MKKNRFENQPLRSLMQDKKVMEELLGQAEDIKEQLADTEGLGSMEGMPLEVGIERQLQDLTRLLEAQEVPETQFGTAEAIVLTSTTVVVKKN